MCKEQAAGHAKMKFPAPAPIHPAGVAVRATIGGNALKHQTDRKACNRVTGAATARRRSLMCLVGVLSLLTAGALSGEPVTLPAHAPSPLTPRYGFYLGVPGTWIPSEALTGRGLEAQVGVLPRRWCTIGVDFTRLTGTEITTVDQIPSGPRKMLQAEVAELEAAGLLPANYRLQVSSAAESTLFSFGPQFNTRAHHGIMLFATPDLGALREKIRPHPTDPFVTSVVHEFIPSGEKVDWTPFYGAGGGVELPLSPHIGIKSMVDAVYSHPFNDLLAHGFWSYRLSTGVTYRFGSHRESR